MDFLKFINSITDKEPAPTLNPELMSLWYDKNGNWQLAHEIIQNESARISKLIHAYLHRKEGDLWNANYWYRSANEEMPKCSLNQEWEDLVKMLCE